MNAPTIQFAVSQPFKVPTTLNRFDKKAVDKKGIAKFSETANSTKIGSVADKRGCYVFSLRAGRGEKPWYVGKAAKQGFRDECFELHKLRYFDEAIAGSKGTPRLLFVFHKKPGRGKWATNAINELEEYLIGLAYARNPSLQNRRRLPAQKWYIPGVVASGKGKPSIGSASLKALLGVK